VQRHTALLHMPFTQGNEQLERKARVTVVYTMRAQRTKTGSENLQKTITCSESKL